ncbi:GTP-binding protein, partial [candidate division FCPU426 bacterium]|nr:GTP-binding protein [candidate division FCPU426 bacterium]
MIKDYKTENIQTILFAGHGQVGKTTLNESLLAAGASIKEPGAVDKGTTVSDFDEEEIARHMSLKSSTSFVEYQDHKINFLDAPGSPDFIGEIRACLHVVDSVIILVDAEVGVQIEAEKHARLAREFNVPRVAFVNKLDKENADFEAALRSISEKFGKPAIPFWLPMGKGSGFKGVIDLFTMKALTFAGEAATPQVSDIPPDIKQTAETAREKLIEAAAEGDDALTEKFLDGQPLSDAEVSQGLNEVIRSGNFIPVWCGCAHRVACAQALLDNLLQVMPHSGQHPVFQGFEP